MYALYDFQDTKPDASGEVRINCPNCTGSQKNTLGVNVDTGAFHCFRCDLRGNYLKKNGYEKQPMPEWLYDQATQTVSHSYTEKKQIKPQEIRVDIHGNWVVPFKGRGGKIKTVQFISPKGEKRFLSKAKGGQFKGSAYVIHGSTGTIYYCEGPATGHSIHDAGGATTYCCGGKDNLDAVMEWAVRRYPNSKHVVAADNDKNGDGYRIAEAAAKKHGAMIVCPGPTGDFNDFAVESGLGAVKAVLENPMEPGPDKSVDSSTFSFIKLSSVEFRLPDWLIKGFLEKDTLSMFFGDPGCGKTFFGVDISCSVATGKLFHDRIVFQGPVLYLAGEGHNGLKRRFRAWEIRHQVALDDAPIYVSNGPGCFCDAAGAKMVAAAIEASEVKPVAVIVDTVARNFGPGDENSTQDMTAFINGLDLIRTQYGCAVILIHHTGHADKSRGRGAMALKGALDAEYRLDKDDMGVVRMDCTKMKDFEPPHPTAFRINTVELGIFDEDGQEITSAVLDSAIYEPPAKKGSQGRGKNQTVALEMLDTLYQEHRDNLTNSNFDPSTARVTVDDWRDRCIDAGMSRQSWHACKKSLEQQSAVEIAHGYVEKVNA
ncbi:AAA family ATPase [uncultured Desulfobacter sp.]|uniref:AAA family ATPase n=1 Tax=uncultured Desulfobacter sp. TaxID=240139 RepID=UPI002AA623EC|nr:AAA family ATPase [uncultured Desulfobacter sp.]